MRLYLTKDFLHSAKSYVLKCLIIPTPSPSDSARDLKKKIMGEVRATARSFFRANKKKGIQLKTKKIRERPDI